MRPVPVVYVRRNRKLDKFEYGGMVCVSAKLPSMCNQEKAYFQCSSSFLQSSLPSPAETARISQYSLPCHAMLCYAKLMVVSIALD